MQFPKFFLTAAGATLFFQPVFAQTHWVGTWGTAPATQLETGEMEKQKLVFHNQTVRDRDLLALHPFQDIAILSPSAHLRA